MKKQELENSMLGFFIGAVAGVVIGFLFLNQVKKSQRESTLPVSIALGAIFGGITGASIGFQIGRNAYRKERLGINKPEQDGFMKDGKFWVGMTVWIDTRDQKKYTLITARSNIKNLVTVLNNNAIIVHNSQSASKTTIPKFHTQAKELVWNKLKSTYTEKPVPIEDLFPTIQA